MLFIQYCSQPYCRPLPWPPTKSLQASKFLNTFIWQAIYHLSARQIESNFSQYVGMVSSVMIPSASIRYVSVFTFLHFQLVFFTKLYSQVFSLPVIALRPVCRNSNHAASCNPVANTVFETSGGGNASISTLSSSTGAGFRVYI